MASKGTGGTAHDDPTPVEISRNPFTRQSLLRIVLPDPRGACGYCGETPRFRYGLGTLNGKPIDWDNTDFCGKDCRDIFYGRER